MYLLKFIFSLLKYSMLISDVTDVGTWNSVHAGFYFTGIVSCYVTNVNLNRPVIDVTEI
jgi:hypothetical protein